MTYIIQAIAFVNVTPNISVISQICQHQFFQIFPFYMKLQTITHENSEKSDLLLNIVIAKYRHSLNSKKKCNSALFLNCFY